MSTKFPLPPAAAMPKSARIGVVAARWNAAIVDELLAGCLRQLNALGVTDDRIQLLRVPGAFESPVAAKWLADAGCAAVICLGAVIRGDTPHFDYVAGEAARGIQSLSIATGVPIIFGVLTTNTEQQALDRIGGSHGHAGEAAANAAVEMAALKASLSRSS